MRILLCAALVLLLQCSDALSVSPRKLIRSVKKSRTVPKSAPESTSKSKKLKAPRLFRKKAKPASPIALHRAVASSPGISPSTPAPQSAKRGMKHLVSPKKLKKKVGNGVRKFAKLFRRKKKARKPLTDDEIKQKKKHFERVRRLLGGSRKKKAAAAKASKSDQQLSDMVEVAKIPADVAPVPAALKKKSSALKRLKKRVLKKRGTKKNKTPKTMEETPAAELPNVGERGVVAKDARATSSKASATTKTQIKAVKKQAAKKAAEEKKIAKKAAQKVAAAEKAAAKRQSSKPRKQSSVLGKIKSVFGIKKKRASASKSSQTAPKRRLLEAKNIRGASTMEMGLNRNVCPASATTCADVKKRAVGSLLGLAVGDAVGTTLEFKARGSFSPISDMVGGGPFKLKPGYWTDDTIMAVCLADAYAQSGKLNIPLFYQNLDAWYTEGKFSPTGTCFDIGNTTADAINRWRKADATQKADPAFVTGGTSRRNSGNGSIIRLAPAVIFNVQKGMSAVVEDAVQQSKVTHGSDLALSCSRVLAYVLQLAITTGDRQAVFTAVDNLATQYTALFHSDLPSPVRELLTGYKTKSEEEISSSGFCVHSLEAALWSVWHTSDFKEAILKAVNLGDDADSVGAVAGQIAGAIYGVDAIPESWRKRLFQADQLTQLAELMFDHA